MEALEIMSKEDELKLKFVMPKPECTSHIFDMESGYIGMQEVPTHIYNYETKEWDKINWKEGYNMQGEKTTPEQFKEVLGKLLKDIRETEQYKGAIYSRNGDRLHNFRKLSAMRGGKPMEACLIDLVSKHFLSLVDFIEDLEKGIDNQPEEMWDERIGDIIVYMILLKGIREERKRELEKLEGGRFPKDKEPLSIDEIVASKEEKDNKFDKYPSKRPTAYMDNELVEKEKVNKEKSFSEYDVINLYEFSVKETGKDTYSQNTCAYSQEEAEDFLSRFIGNSLQNLSLTKVTEIKVPNHAK